MVGVFGDVHGCYYTLFHLYEIVRDKYGDIPLYSTGDLVDRGNHSSKVIEFVIAENIKPILGNHECLFYYAFEFPNHPYRDVWAANGNFKTLNDYAGNPELLQNHVQYCKKLPLYYNLPDCFICHAGLSILFESNLNTSASWEDPLWTEFLNNHMHEEIGVLWNRTTLFNCGKIQVVGHTKHRDAKFDKRTLGLYIDTGAYTGNMLSCAILDNNTIVEILTFPTVPKDILFTSI